MKGTPVEITWYFGATLALQRRYKQRQESGRGGVRDQGEVPPGLVRLICGDSPALLLVGEAVLLLGDEGLKDVSPGRDADGHVAIVNHGQAVHPVLEHHRRRLGHVRPGSHAALRETHTQASKGRKNC